MIDIKSYAKPKNTSSNVSAGGSSVGGTINISDERIAEIVEGVVSSSIQNISIVNGDNTLQITKTADGTSVNFTINSLTWTFDQTTGHLKYLGAIDTNSINTSSITSTQGNISTFTSGNATITTLTGNNLTFDNGEIDDLVGETINYQNCTLENLTVTKAAHFFELIIDQIKSTQGQIIITPANAKIDWVDSTPTNYYRCYWKYEDDEKQIGNQFSVNDQVVCQTFNVTTGTTHSAANKYYWALVVNTGSTTIDGENYHYIDISKTDKDNASNGVPEAGDEIAQLGNRNLTDRQAAIIISAYNNQFLDATVQAPSIVQYAGINNYNLSSHRTNVISKGFNQFKGKFSTNSGDDIEDLINDIGQGTTMYIHTAYANSADGQTDFSKTYFSGAAYIGMCSNFSSTDTDLVYSNYTWMRMKGETGDAGFSYNLLPTREFATVSKTDVLSLGFTYQLVKVEGTTVTQVNPAQSNFYMRFKSDIAPYTQLNRGTTSFSFSSNSYYTNYHTQTTKPTYFVIELLQDQTIVETRVVNVRFAAGAELTIADEITASVQSVEGDLNTFEQSANSSISSLTNRMGTAESNITQTQTSIRTEVTARINGDKKYFPILKPWYDYQNNLITDYANDPLRYKGDADIYSTPTYLEPGTYKVRVFVNSSALGSSYAICYHGNQYPNDLGSYDPISGFTLSSTGKYIAAKDDTTLYEYAGEVTISENGYYGLNWWENYYIYVPEESNEFESNYSRITQTNNRITTEVGNINGQISTINQTAEDIQLQVNETSIRLNDGDITLTGNTKVQGDLTISDATNGFTITNESNYNTVIKPQSIGNYSDYATREITRQELNYSATNELVTGNIKSKDEHPADTEYFEVRFNNNPDNHTIYLESGTILNLNSFNRFGMNILNTYSYTHRIYGKLDYYGITVNEGGYTPSTQNYDSRVYIKGYKQYGNETVNVELISVHIYSIQTRISVLDANNNEVGYVVLNGNTPTLNYNYTATTTGNYKIKTSSLIRFNSIYNYTGERADNVFTNYMRTVFFMNIKTTLSSNQIENIIGYDGIALSLGTNNTVYMGKDTTIIGYGNSKLMINGNGIFKYAGSTTPQYQSENIMGTDTGLSLYAAEWVKINGCVVRVLTQSGTFYLQPRDEVISYRGTSQDSYLWINRPSQEIGRKIYVKPTGNRTNINIGTYSGDTNSYFMESLGRGTHRTIEIGDIGITLISDGSYWWMYYPY